MYPVNAPAVYAHGSVMGNPVYRARVERVVAALKGKREVILYADNDVPRLIRDDGIFRNRVIMGTRPDMPDPILLFNTFRFGDDDAAFRALAAWADAITKTDRGLTFKDERPLKPGDTVGGVVRIAPLSLITTRK